MMQMKCEGPQCEKTTNPDRPGLGWVEVRELNTTLQSTPRVRHYCSPNCEHAHSYLLISGDNGK